MRVLIAGAGGYLGEHVVQVAAQAGHSVSACVRGPRGPRFPADVRRVEGDLGDPAFVRRAVADVDAVVFSAGRTWHSGLTQESIRQNVSIVEIFLAALAQSNPSARVVITSSMSAIAGSLEPVVFGDDSSPTGVCTARLSPYDHAKIECERLARAAGRNLVILNPGFMLGPGASAASRVTTSRMVQLFCRRRLRVFVEGGGHAFCDVRDVARAHVAALANGTRNNRYILGGENLSSAQFLRLISEQTGIRTPRPIAARHALAVAATLDGLSAASFGLWRSPIPRSFARALPLYYWGDSTGAERDLGYRSRRVVQTIRETIADFVRRGLVSEEFRYVEAMTDETQPGLLLLKQLAQSHLHRSHLMARLPRILATCRHNHCLSEALDAALASAIYDPGRGRFVWKGAAPANALRKLRSLLDFCYYASDEFRARVT